jgi:hypothetical protein
MRGAGSDKADRDCDHRGPECKFHKTSMVRTFGCMAQSLPAVSKYFYGFSSLDIVLSKP